MSKQPKFCETYQLKWSSFSSYIHSCISNSLQQTESFADVALVTTDGHQIMAHRFVLAYSSLFLGQILRMQKKVTTALPLMIVLPPEIDHKSLKVLVRYMYSGEAKVSKEILESVLRGGDILQIKGLYREKEENQDKNARLTQHANKPPTATFVPSDRPPLLPVELPLKAPPITLPSTTTAIINTTAIPSTSKQAQPIQMKTPAPTSPVKTQEKAIPGPSQKILVVQKAKEPQMYANPKQKVLNFTLMQNFDKNILDKDKDEASKRVTILNKSLDKPTNEDSEQIEPVTVKIEPKESNNLQYLMIKDEPIDWNDSEMEIMDSKEEVYDNVFVKSENETNGSESNDDDNMFSPLTCELCTETFTVLAEWVRHVQTHTDMLPAKRRRRDSTGDSYENDTFPELMCDLCQKSFPTPAEWVRHVQNTHTEFELHLSNKKNPGSGKAHLPCTSTQAQGNDLNKCHECDKTFPSHASMLIHKRRHTGEKPYACDYCPKTFNVKSNLLRHLRTLHNKIIASTEVENKECSDNSN